MKDHQKPYQVSNCAFDAQCNSSWQELSHTDQLNIRYCPRCDTHIHLCETLEDVIWHARLDNAVAFSKKRSQPLPSTYRQ